MNRTVFLNSSIPRFFCWLRNEYLYDLQHGHGNFTQACVFGISSIPNRAIGFHCLTDRGAQIARLPISALVHHIDAPDLPLNWLQVWDCLSDQVAVTAYEHLADHRCRVLLKDRKWYDGTCKFTIDWCHSPYADDPTDGGHKCAHFIKLDNGCFAAQPNNRIIWYDEAVIVDPIKAGERPDYLTNSHVWKCEGSGKWAAENTDRFFYDISEDQQEPEDPI